MNGCEREAVLINNGTFNDALYKAYEYHGGKVKFDLFKQAINDMDSDNAIELFQLLTGETILYFGAEKYAFKYGLAEI